MLEAAGRDADFQDRVVAYLQGLSIDEQRSLLRGVWGDWTPDVDADSEGMEAAFKVKREIGADPAEILPALINIMDPLEVRSLIRESAKQKEAEEAYLRLLIENTVRGDLSPHETARKVQRYLGAA